MSTTARVVVAIVGVVVVLGVVFYAWLALAFTPRRPPGDGTRHRLIREAELARSARFRILHVTGPAGEHHEIQAGTRGVTGRIEFSRILRTRGTPVPTDVRPGTGTGVVIVFDGPLADGTRNLALELTDSFGATGPYEVRDGRLTRMEAW